MKKHRTHKEYLNRSLKEPREAALYLTAAAEENDPALLIAALAQVARAQGLARTARRSSLSRMGLYKSLSRTGNPELRTFLNILDASGLQLAFKPRLKRAA